ncbi:MAG: AAA family ATPase [Deltaproteobacteria bacterium]|nr:AAA family ATPase [Deltaproteobacteria bacterium]MBW2305787.1 AAA family ATPase [Deltaproteobacteria bacterium]
MESLRVFLTGPPRSGKTTVIERILSSMRGPASGFHTREIRRKGRRLGFRIVTLDGKEAVLAHRDTGGPYRVGAYGVDVENLERVAVPSIVNRPPGEILVIDEVGKMECLSAKFCRAVRKALSGPNPILGSVGLKGDGFMEEVRKWPGLRLIHVSAANRNELPGLISREFQTHLHLHLSIANDNKKLDIS